MKGPQELTGIDTVWCTQLLDSELVEEVSCRDTISMNGRLDSSNLYSASAELPE